MVETENENRQGQYSEMNDIKEAMTGLWGIARKGISSSSEKQLRGSGICAEGYENVLW